MRHGVICALILVMATAGTSAAAVRSAESRAERWDFSIQTRYAWSQEITGDNGGRVDFEDDLGWGFGFGYHFSEQFKLGFSLAWHSIYYRATAFSDDGSGDTRTYANYLDTSTLALTGDYTFGKSRLKPYVSGNLGWLAVDTNITADIDVGCWYDPWWGYICNEYVQTYGTDAFTYGLGLGLQFDLSPAAFLKAGWDHNWNDLDAMNSNDLLRIDIGFLL